MRIHRNETLISAFVDGCLETARAALVREHLENCAECRRIQGEIERARQALAGLEVISAPSGLAEEIIAEMTARENCPAPRTRSLALAFGTLALLVIVARVALDSERPGLPDTRVATAPAEVTGETPAGPALDLLPPPEPEAPGEMPMTAVRDRAEPPAPAAAPRPVPDEEIVFEEEISRPADLPERSRALAPAERGRISERAEAPSRKPVMMGMEPPGEPDAEADSETPPVDAPRRVMMTGAISMVAEPEPAMISAEALKEVPPGALVITGRVQFEREWHAQGALQALEPSPPEVDFSEKMVVALPLRQKGKAVRVLESFERNDTAVVRYRLEIDEAPVPDTPVRYQFSVVGLRSSVEIEKAGD